MHTQAEKPRESRSRAAANSVNQKPHVKDTTLQLTDNRPEMIQLRKLQDIITNNSQERQQAQLLSAIPISKRSGPIPAQRVVQLATLVGNKLNVAGETHPESDKRRPLEKEVSYKKTGSTNYWREGEFTKAGSDQPADPYQLRYEQLIQFGLSLLTSTVVLPKEEYFESFGVGDIDILKPIESALNEFHADDLETYGELLHGRLQERDIWIAGLRRVILYQCRVAKETVNVLKQKNTSSKDGFISIDIMALDEQVRKSAPLNKAVNEIREALDEMHKALVAAGSDLKISGRNISSERSDAMHISAQAKADVKGVWKLGEQHAEDLKTKDAKAYNLLSKADFNAEILSYQEAQKLSDDSSHSCIIS